MSIPHIFSPVKPQDFTLRPITVNKKFVIQRSDLYSGSFPQTASGYRIWEGLYIGEHLKLGTNSTYPTNSFDDTYKQVIWKSIDAQYYRFSYDRTATKEHSNPRFTKKFLNYSASILSVPYMDFGESIKPGSVEITGSTFNLTDDKNGNLYDVSLETGSYSNRYNLIAYWGFDDQFRKMKELPYAPTGQYDGPLMFLKTKIKYESGIFQPDEESIAKNVTMLEGLYVDGVPSGQSAFFDNYAGNHISYILTPNRKEFNFSKDDDFTISLWVQPFTNGPTGTLISKNTIISKQVEGYFDKPNQNDLSVSTLHVSMSTTYEPTPIYPFRLEVSDLLDLGNGQVLFSRSDGTNTLQLSGSSTLFNSDWHHIAVVKSGSQLSLYQDGLLQQVGNDVNYHPINAHSIMFGNDSFDGFNKLGESCGLHGRLDEIRFFNKGLSNDTILSLADSSNVGVFQTSIVGNVFYRSGNIVISSLDSKYNQTFQDNFTVRYRGTHTIYQYEALVRIKAGSYNMSLNPTMLKNPSQDLIIDAATGSLESGALFPYCTTIGLYNDSRELLAVAKLNQPIMMRDDVDINIIASFDA